MITKMQIDLNKHCIETAAKNEFKFLMDKYFTTDSDNSNLENKIELLREFIEVSNFKLLRSSDIRLSGSADKDITIFLHKAEDGSFTIEIL